MGPANGGCRPPWRSSAAWPSRVVIYGILTDDQRQTFETDNENRYELDFAYSVPGLGRFRFNVHE